MKNWKKHPKKLLRISPDPFFPRSSPGHSQQPKIDFPYHEISGPEICSLICAMYCDCNIFYASDVTMLFWRHSWIRIVWRQESINSLKSLQSCFFPSFCFYLKIDSIVFQSKYHRSENETLSNATRPLVHCVR